MDPPTSTRAASRKNRVYELRRFLLETYPDLFSSRQEGDKKDKPSIVLDVAGGKGDLSWLLVNTIDSAEIASVVVDPRLTKHKHLCKSVSYLRDHPAEAILRAIPDQPTHQPLAALLEKIPATFRRTHHLRLLLDNYLVEAIQDFQITKSKAAWSQFWSDAMARARRAQTLGYVEKNTDDDEFSCAVIDDADEALETILSARLIVGFHPDQVRFISWFYKRNDLSYAHTVFSLSGH